MLKLLIPFFFVLITNCVAEVVKYEDDKGKTVYVDSFEKVPEKYKSQASQIDPKHSLSRTTSNRENLYEKEHYSDSKPSKVGIEIFVTSWCGYCRKLEEDLKNDKVNYTKYDVETSDIGKKTYQSLGGGGIPIIRLGGKKILRGYSSLSKIYAEMSKLQ